MGHALSVGRPAADRHRVENGYERDRADERRRDLCTVAAGD